MRRIKATLVLLATVSFAFAAYDARNFDGYSPANFPFSIDYLPFQPAPWTFAIWGVILIWLIVHALYGLILRSDDPLWDRARKPLLISLVIGASWLAVAERFPLAATALIWVMAYCATWALGRSPRETDDVWRIDPVGLYAGWLTAATGVATGTVLVGYGVMSPTTTALVVLAAVSASGILFGALVDAPPSYTVGVIWAYLGILSANTGHTTVLVATCFALVAVAIPAWRRERLYAN